MDEAANTLTMDLMERVAEEAAVPAMADEEEAEVVAVIVLERLGREGPSPPWQWYLPSSSPSSSSLLPPLVVATAAAEAAVVSWTSLMALSTSSKKRWEPHRQWG